MRASHLIDSISQLPYHISQPDPPVGGEGSWRIFAKSWYYSWISQMRASHLIESVLIQKSDQSAIQIVKR